MRVRSAALVDKLATALSCSPETITHASEYGEYSPERKALCEKLNHVLDTIMLMIEHENQFGRPK